MLQLIYKLSPEEDEQMRQAVEQKFKDELSAITSSIGLFRLISLKHEFPNFGGKGRKTKIWQTLWHRKDWHIIDHSFLGISKHRCRMGMSAEIRIRIWREWMLK